MEGMFGSKYKYVIFIILTKLFRVKRVSTKREKRLFREIWIDIWKEEGYKENAEYFSEYDRYSCDYLVKFLGIIGVGTLRLIKYNNHLALPIIKDFDIVLPKSTKIIEATLFAVKRNFRRRWLHIPSLLLMRELARYCKKNGIYGALMILDKRLYIRLKYNLGFPIQEIGKEKFYKGSLCVPCFINTEEFFKNIEKINPFFAS